MSESQDEPVPVVAGGEGSQTGENTCPDCGGSGRLGEDECPVCGGRGTVVEPVGDA